MLRNSPIIVQTVSGVDWPAVAAAISTGVAAIAGIGATLWQAKRNSNQEEKRIKITEKRRIFAGFLEALNRAINAAITVQRSSGPSQAAKDAMRELNNAMTECMGIVFQLELIASKDVNRYSAKTLMVLGIEGADAAQEPMAQLTKAMRADLGESSFSIDLPRTVSKSPGQT